MPKAMYELTTVRGMQIDEACYLFIKYQFDNNMLLIPHQWIMEAYAALKDIYIFRTDNF